MTNLEKLKDYLKLYNDFLQKVDDKNNLKFKITIDTISRVLELDKILANGGKTLEELKRTVLYNNIQLRTIQTDINILRTIIGLVENDLNPLSTENDLNPLSKGKKILKNIESTGKYEYNIDFNPLSKRDKPTEEELTRFDNNLNIIRIIQPELFEPLEKEISELFKVFEFDDEIVNKIQINPHFKLPINDVFNTIFKAIYNKKVLNIIHQKNKFKITHIFHPYIIREFESELFVMGFTQIHEKSSNYIYKDLEDNTKEYEFVLSTIKDLESKSNQIKDHLGNVYDIDPIYIDNLDKRKKRLENLIEKFNIRNGKFIIFPLREILKVEEFNVDFLGDYYEKKYFDNIYGYTREESDEPINLELQILKKDIEKFEKNPILKLYSKSELNLTSYKISLNIIINQELKDKLLNDADWVKVLNNQEINNYVNENKSFKSLVSQGINYFEMLDFVEAEQCFQKYLLEYHILKSKVSLPPITNIEDYLGLFIYPTLCINPKHKLLVPIFNSALNHETIKEHIVNNNEVISKFSLDTILNFYNNLAKDNFGTFGFYLAISNGVFDLLPEDKKPKFTIKDALKCHNEYAVYIIKSMIENNEFPIQEYNITLDDLNTYLNRKVTSLLTQFVPYIENELTIEEKNQIFNAYLSEYYVQNSVSEENKIGTRSMLYITEFDDIVKEYLSNKKDENEEKVDDFIVNLKHKFLVVKENKTQDIFTRLVNYFKSF